MNTAVKIAQLKQLLERSRQVTVLDSDDASFKAWKNSVERILIRIFGESSPEVNQFRDLRFYYFASIMSLGADYSREHREAFQRDFQILCTSIASYIEELEQCADGDDEVPVVAKTKSSNKVFISHSSQDTPFVEELIEILECVGLTAESIFCSSFAGYGVNFGENFLDKIKNELNNDTLVLFVLSRKFYASPVCLCEMGATWIQTKDHIPILIPPFDFSDVKGVIPLTHGFKLNEPPQLNLFKKKIESMFHVAAPLNDAAWERKRDRIVGRLNEKIAAQSQT